MAAALSGIVRATPDFMCAAGTFHRLPSISPHVARMTSPVLGQHVEQQQFQRACRGLRALPQFGEEAGQIPPRHRWSRLHVHGHARKEPQDVGAGVGAAEPTGINGHGVLDRLLDAPKHPPCGLVGGLPDRFDDVQHVGLRQTGRGLVHQRTGNPIHGLLPVLQMGRRPLAAHVGDEGVHVLAERDRPVRDAGSGQNGSWDPALDPLPLSVQPAWPVRPPATWRDICRWQARAGDPRTCS